MSRIDNVHNRKRALVGDVIEGTITSIESGLNRLVDGMVYADTKQTESMTSFHKTVEAAVALLKSSFSSEISASRTAHDRKDYYGIDE